MTRFDPGLQPERTALAWRRTALTALIGSAIALRVLPAAASSALGLLPGVAGILLAGAILIVSSLPGPARSARVEKNPQRPRVTSGALLALVAILASTAGIVSLILAAAVATRTTE